MYASIEKALISLSSEVEAYKAKVSMLEDENESLKVSVMHYKRIMQEEHIFQRSGLQRPSGRDNPAALVAPPLGQGSASPEQERIDRYARENEWLWARVGELERILAAVSEGAGQAGRAAEGGVAHRRALPGQEPSPLTMLAAPLEVPADQPLDPAPMVTPLSLCGSIGRVPIYNSIPVAQQSATGDLLRTTSAPALPFERDVIARDLLAEGCGTRLDRSMSDSFLSRAIDQQQARKQRALRALRRGLASRSGGHPVQEGSRDVLDLSTSSKEELDSTVAGVDRMGTACEAARAPPVVAEQLPLRRSSVEGIARTAREDANLAFQLAMSENSWTLAQTVRDAPLDFTASSVTTPASSLISALLVNDRNTNDNPPPRALVFTARDANLREVVQKECEEEPSAPVGPSAEVAVPHLAAPSDAVPGSPNREAGRASCHAADDALDTSAPQRTADGTGRPSVDSADAVWKEHLSSIRGRATKAAGANSSSMISATSPNVAEPAPFSVPSKPANRQILDNPNQLGAIIDDDGPRTRAWYTHRILRLAFAKAITFVDDGMRKSILGVEDAAEGQAHGGPQVTADPHGGAATSSARYVRPPPTWRTADARSTSADATNPPCQGTSVAGNVRDRSLCRDLDSMHRPSGETLPPECTTANVEWYYSSSSSSTASRSSSCSPAAFGPDRVKCYTPPSSAPLALGRTASLDGADVLSTTAQGGVLHSGQRLAATLGQPSGWPTRSGELGPSQLGLLHGVAEVCRAPSGEISGATDHTAGRISPSSIIRSSTGSMLGVTLSGVNACATRSPPRSNTGHSSNGSHQYSFHPSYSAYFTQTSEAECEAAVPQGGLDAKGDSAHRGAPHTASATPEPSPPQPGVFKSTNDVALQRAISETYHLHFHCKGNTPVMHVGLSSPTPLSASLADDNSDPELIAMLLGSGAAASAALANAASSRAVGRKPGEGLLTPGKFRDDEVRVSFHAPVVFSQIRSVLDFDNETFRLSLAKSVWRRAMSPGKSDASMYYFGDFVIKQVKESEYSFLTQRFFPHYAMYCEKNPYTLLPRFYSLFTLTWLKKGYYDGASAEEAARTAGTGGGRYTSASSARSSPQSVLRTGGGPNPASAHGDQDSHYGGRKDRYVLMQNVFSTKQYVRSIYDIKGSTVGRTASKTSGARTAFGALLLKDNDLPETLINCGPVQRAVLLAQLRSDTWFLQSLSVVDYSCLVGIRSRVVAWDDAPSRTALAKGGWERCASSDQTLHASPPGQDATGAPDGAHAGAAAPIGEDGGHGGAGDASFDRDIASGGKRPSAVCSGRCLFSCDGGLLSRPIFSEDDDSTAVEEVYYIGLIDVLQTYTPAKRLENFAKGLVNDRQSISVVPPKDFAARLCKLMDRITV